MATSGSIVGNSFGGGKRYIFINWQLATQEINNNRSLINYQAYARFINSDAQLDNGTVDWWGGNLWYNGGRVYNYAGNFSNHDVLLASGSFWVGHYSDGSRDFGMSGGIDYYGDGRSSTSGAWWLPTIPRQANITAVYGDFYDTANPWVEFNNAGGFPVDVYMHLPDVSGSAFNIRTSVGSRYTWSLSDAERNAMRSAMANVKTTRVQYVVRTNIGGTYYYSTTDRTMIITDADPIFSTVTYEDNNSTTTAITGANQYLIQGYSTLLAKIASGDKATAQKYATMVKYNFAISSISSDETYTTSAINKALGVLSVNADTNLAVKAIDSRGNFTTVNKTIKVLPYAVPNVVATARRVNNFETSTNFHIEGTISRLTISGTDKNAVNTSTGVAYRYKKVTDVSWGSWTNKTSATTAGAVSVTDFAVNLDRNYAWNVEVRITDKLETSTLALVVPIGTPIFRVSTYDNLVYNNEQPLMPSHVGQIIHSTTLTTAGAVQAIYGGTWVAWGTGRVLVGMGSNGTNNYTTVEATGGSDAVTLTTAQLPSHNHSLPESRSGSAANPGTFIGYPYSNSGGTATASATGTGSNGSGNSHENRQSYITAYMWKRTV